MFGLGGPSRPKVVAFDVIGTLFPLEPLRPAVVALGLPGAALEGWFAAGLRDAFALSAVDDFKPFPEVLEEAMNQVLAEQKIEAPAGAAAGLVAQIGQLSARSDARYAFEILKEAGLRIIALTNGSPTVTKTLIAQAELDGFVERIVSVEEVKLFKPRREVYARAAEVSHVEAGELALVAAHGWDIHGAGSAGLVTAYLDAERPFPHTMRKPDLEAGTLSQLARGLADLPSPS